jgi:RsiW-degrading membrane proteinase PrsW (M82 family)
MVNLILLLLFSLAPVVFWSLFYLEKKFVPLKLIAIVSLSGILLLVAVYLFESKVVSYFFPNLWDYLLNFGQFSFLEIPFYLFLLVFFVIAPLEEIPKFFILKRIISKSKDINQVIDGIQLGIIFGLAFASGENFLKFSLAAAKLDSFSFGSVFFLRLLVSTLAQIIYSGVMGYYLCLGRFHKLYRRFMIERAIVFPLLLHGIFNFFLLAETAYLSVLMLAVLTIVFYKWYNDRKLFEIFIEKKEAPPATPFLSAKTETDVYLSKGGASFDFIKKIGVSPYGFRKKEDKKRKTGV